MSMSAWMASYGFVNTKHMYQAMRMDHGALWDAQSFKEDDAHRETLARTLRSVRCESSRWNMEPFSLGVSGFSQGYLFCMRVALLSRADYQRIAQTKPTMHVRESFSPENERAVVDTLENHLRRTIS